MIVVVEKVPRAWVMASEILSFVSASCFPRQRRQALVWAGAPKTGSWPPCRKVVLAYYSVCLGVAACGEVAQKSTRLSCLFQKSAEIVSRQK